MKIVIAPDSYKESLSALEVATQIELGFKEVFPDAQYVKVPMADGGEGTVQAMIEATHGRRVEVEVTAPLGERIPSFYALTGDGHTAMIEMAAASGLALVPADQREPVLKALPGWQVQLQQTLFKKGIVLKPPLRHISVCSDFPQLDPRCFCVFAEHLTPSG